MDNIDFSVFDAEQQKVLINLKDALEAKNQKDDVGFDDHPVAMKDRQNLKKVEKIWKSGGRIPGAIDLVSIDQLLEKDKEITGKMKSMKDNFSTDLPMLIPRTLSNIVREAIEPNLVLTPLLTRVNFSAGTRVSFPTYGALSNAAADLAEGEEYPEGTMEMGGQTECIIGKSGIACKVTEEQKRYSQYDIISMNLRACGRALARHKEKKVANLIVNQGTVLIDNSSTSYPSATGRNAAGAYNGTLTLDDLFKAWATMVDDGFMPNTLIMHPFAWRIFAENGMARAFGFEHGMASMMWQMAQGQRGYAPQWTQTMLNQNTYVSGPEELATTFTRVPSIFPTQFSIIVSPYMTYNASNNTTDIVFCDVNELGILVVDEEVTSDEWTDPARDIMKVKFRERYGLAIKNDGRGVGLFKNIKIGKSVDFAERATLSYGTGDIASPLTGDEAYVGNPL